MTIVYSQSLQRRTRTEAAAYIMAQFHELGLELPSRVVEMHRVLSRGNVPFDDPDFFTALESLRDLHQLTFLFEQLHIHRDNPRFQKVVKHLLNDSVLPQHDKDSPGRDRQFELYLAAICQNAGLVPVDYEEPDITCFIDGAKFGIAAKRLKSRKPSQLEKHVRKGADQLRQQGLPGIVALELSLSRNQSNRPIISQIDSQMHLMIADAKNRDFRDKHGDAIRRWVAGTGVRAVLVIETTLRLRPDRQWWHDGMSSWMPITLDDEQADPLFTAFYNGFLKGVPNLEDSGTEG
jgi:hypothetical protein